MKPWYKIFAFSMILFFSFSVNAQDIEILEVLKTLSTKMNLKLSVADTLYPLKISKSVFSLHLLKYEIKEIKKHNKRQKGKKLDQSWLDGVNFISAKLIYEAFKKLDSVNTDYIEKNKPFYLISNPLFFSNQKKAIVDIDLIGSGGYTYLLLKKDNEWFIEEEIVRWIV